MINNQRPLEDLQNSNKSYLIDSIVLLLLTVITILFAVKFVNFSETPYEDAAILMRYAEHFANGFGIVWNAGGRPVDGATDFLFMILTGFLVKIGTHIELAVRVIALLSHLFTVYIVYFSLRDIFRAPVLAAFVSSAYLIVGPGLYYAAAFFGTPFFALFTSITWLAALIIIQKGATRESMVIFAVSALITSLTRPEGVILTFLMLISVFAIRGFRAARSTAGYYLGIILVFGGLYFYWHWNYFGYPLPNPYYIKGNGTLHYDSLMSSVYNTLKLCLPFLPVYFIGLYSSKTFRLTIGLLIPVIGFTLAFVLISNEMNFGARFQYALLPIVLMSWWPMAAVLKEEIKFPAWKSLNFRRKFVFIIFIASVIAGVVYYQYKSEKLNYYHDGRYDIAVMLSGYKDLGLNLATTESGLLPLYSQWKSLDTWGLNDPWIAHNGGITEDYLEKFQPDVIVSDCPFSPVVPFSGGKDKRNNMIMTIKNYAEKNLYILAAAYGVSPYHTEYYYVRPHFPWSDEIILKIRNTEFYWWNTGQIAVNYAVTGLDED